MKTQCLRFPSRLRQVRFHLQCSDEGAGPQEGGSGRPCWDPILERAEQEQREREEVLQVFQSIQRTLPELHSLVQTRLDQWAPYILELGLRLAGEVLGRELEAGNYDLIPVIRESLSQAVGADDESLLVFLNPQDLGRVLERWGNGQAQEGQTHQREPEFQVDPGVPPGACRIESNHGRIVHDPGSVLEAMIKKILGELGQ